MSINQSVRRTSARGLFTQASLDALLLRMAEVICEHGRRWQRDRWNWRTEGHPPSLNAPEAQPKHRRAELFGEGKKRGMSVDNLKQLFRRKKKSDGRPDFEAIEAYIKRYGKEAKTTVASADAMSLEVQIVAWEERLAEAPLGGDQWCEAQDALQRLRQLQQGAHL